MTTYEQGFITKCAEYGVDPEWLVKMAVGVKNIGKIYTLASKFSTRAYKRALDAALKGGRTYEQALFEAEQAAAKASSKFNGFTRVKSLNKGLENAANFSKNYGKKTVSQVGTTVSGSVPPKITAKEIERAAANSQATINPVKNVRSRVQSSSGRVPRKRIDPATGRVVPRVRSVSGKSPVGPVASSGAGINFTPYGAVEGVGGNIPIMPGYTAATGSTPAIDAARTAARRTPVRDTSSPEKLGPWGRFLQLMGGGNENARKITSNRKAVRAMKRFLAEGSGTAPLGSDKYTKAVGGFNSKISDTNADIARRLQNGGTNELRKVLATRLGTGAAVTGLGALGVNEMQPDYRSSDPRHSLDYWGY